MSADVAWAFWSNPARAEQPVEAKAPDRAWPDLQSDYRARIRKVMRVLVGEGLSFRQLPALPAPLQRSEQWSLDTGRLAWILWLTTRRAQYPADEATERKLWKAEAADYRAYVRAVLGSLRKSGIVFAE